MMRLAGLGLALGISVLAARPADACVHAASAAKVQVSQKGQRILVVHDGAQQTTVLRVEYDAGAALSDLAMVIPVPDVPTAYDTSSEALFTELEDWAPLLRAQPRTARAKGKSAASAAPDDALVELLTPAKAGPYAIQPLKARGPDGAKAVSQWLKDNGYTPIPEAALSYYAERQWTFLAVKASAEHNGALDDHGSLPPLSFSFPTTRVVVPMKLEAQGVFPVRVYLVSTDAFADADFKGAQAKGFEVASAPGLSYLLGEGAPTAMPVSTLVGAFQVGDAPAELGKVLASAAKGATSLTLRVLLSESFGRGAADPSTWGEELAVPGLEGAASPEAKTADATPAAAKEAKPADAEPADAKPADAKSDQPAPKKKAPASAGCRIDASGGPLAPWVGLLLLGLVATRRRA